MKMREASPRSALYTAVAALGPAPRVVVWFAGAIAVIGVLAVSAFVLNTDSSLIKLGEEANLPTWLSTVQLFVVGAVLAFLAVRDVDRHSPRTWPLLLAPGLFLLLSIDEAAMLHERLGDWLQSESGIGSGLRTGPWILVYVPLIGLWLAAATKAIWPYLRGRRQVIALGFVGIALYGLSAVGLEGVANFVVEGSLVHKGLGFLEEMGEMIAVNIILWGVVLLVRTEGINVDWGRQHQPPTATTSDQPW